MRVYSFIRYFRVVSPSSLHRFLEEIMRKIILLQHYFCFFSDIGKLNDTKNSNNKQNVQAIYDEVPNQPKSKILFHIKSPSEDFIRTTLHIMALSYYEVTAAAQREGPKILFPIRCHLLKRKRDLVQNMTQIENIQVGM